MKSKITIKEIAKKAEVSIGTVDRVLHNRGRVAEETKERVMKIAREGNYSSNVYARSLKLNRVFSIAVILPQRNAYWAKHSDGVAKALEEFDYLTTKLYEYDLESEGQDGIEGVLEQVLQDEPDGIVIAPIFLNENSPVIQKLNESKIPVVQVDSEIELSNCISFIGQDAFQSGLMSGNLLDEGYSDDYAVYVITFQAVHLYNKSVVNRIKGLESYYKNKENAPEIININLERDLRGVADILEEMKSSGKKIRLFVPNSGSYLLASDLAPIKKQLQLRMIGYDLIDMNKHFLRDGIINYLIHQQPRQQGYKAIQALHQHLLLKAEVKKEQFLPLDIITKENLMYCEH
ncbi:LacI family DNA-binding transcriptional regulator [Reichenbachiella ulvae]|uniref:LacI family transcriptional regulator n=1 Tax=Reichenbachiella ulvae TaxID=2980104 RepID=A0ABT3CZR8_9BACT|nr:LacI family DNA-binding transcriptional regulator [Reichenbachiella ulvae]MCV9389064.1 LacI family transcriptional regulator [Reichenbachiella ulvae]